MNFHGGSMNVVKDLARHVFSFAVATAACLAIHISVVRSTMLSGIDILFYRGMWLLAFAAVCTLVLMTLLRKVFKIDAATVISATALSTSVALSFFVLFPVTIDRSLSVFMLGHMSAEPTHAYMKEEIHAAFVNEYMGSLRQSERRITEQERSGNIIRTGDGYLLTEQGRRFIGYSRAIAKAFNTDDRFVNQR